MGLLELQDIYFAYIPINSYNSDPLLGKSSSDLLEGRRLDYTARDSGFAGFDQRSVHEFDISEFSTARIYKKGVSKLPLGIDFSNIPKDHNVSSNSLLPLEFKIPSGS